MLEQYLARSALETASAVLAAHATQHRDDGLWDAIEETAEGLPIRALMDS